MTGDYESMVILEDSQILPICPSMNEKTLEAFCLYKTSTKGSKHTVNGRQIRTVEGVEMVCDGSWTNPKNMNQFLAAISTLHKVKGNHGEYREPCAACFQRPVDVRYQGCEHHPGNPLVFRRGNPRLSERTLNAYQNVQAQLSMHYEKGTPRLLLGNCCR